MRPFPFVYSKQSLSRGYVSLCSALGQSRLLVIGFFGTAIALFCLAVSPCGSVAQVSPAPSDARQKELEKMVRQAARHLEHTIKKEGFFSARVALNVWKSTALDAGLYDDATYSDYRQRIYTHSIKANRDWFEGYLQDKNFQNAATCLEFWRLHSLDLGILDPDEYDSLKERLKQAQKEATK